MNKKEIGKMISLADDSYIEEMFTTRLYERKHRGSAWIAAAAAVMIAVGAAGIALNSADSDKIITDIQEILSETETDTSALESAVTTQTWSYRTNNRGYFKNKPDDTIEFYYGLLERYMDFTSDGPVYRFTPEYLDGILRFERNDFLNIEGGLQCDENGVPLYAGIRLFNDDTENLPMVHMVFYKDNSHFADFDKSLYTPEVYGDTELYGFDFSEKKDGSKLMACWRYGDTNYMFTSRGLDCDEFIKIISPYIEFYSKGDLNLMYRDYFTLDSFDLNNGGLKTVFDYKGSNEMNSSSVFAGYVPNYTPFVGLHLTESQQNYEEATLGGEVIYRRYNELYTDPESYEIGNGSEKNYISLIYEWGENPDSDTVNHAPVIPFEEITPEKLDEILFDEDNWKLYQFIIPVNDFTITVIATCGREQLIEAIDAIRSQGGNVTQLTLAEANSSTPFAGYVPQSSSISGMNLTGVISETKDSDVLPEQNELRVLYRGEENGRYTEYVQLYYYKDGTMPTMGTFGRKRTNNFGEPMPVVENPEELSVKVLEDMAVGNGDITKHSFYLNINKAEFYIRAEALCPSEKLMEFFRDMPNYTGLQHSDGGAPEEINSQTVSISTEPIDSENASDDMVTYDGREYRRSDLSEETLEWLDWYNSISKEEQDSVSYVPSELQEFLEYRF